MRVLTKVGLAVAAVAAAGCAAGSPLNKADGLQDDTVRNAQYEAITQSNDVIGKALRNAGAQPIFFAEGTLVYNIKGDSNCAAGASERARDNCPRTGDIEHPRILRGVDVPPSKVGSTTFVLSATVLEIQAIANGTWGEAVVCTWAPNAAHRGLVGNDILQAITTAQQHLLLDSAPGPVITLDGARWWCSHKTEPSPAPSP